MKKRTIFLTGATGVMGFETLRQLSERLDRFDIRLLVRRSKKNVKKLQSYLGNDAIKVVWGNLLSQEDVEIAMGDADIVLHIGGMVSPAADKYPQPTMNVNIIGTRNIISAIKKRPDADNVKLVYIGSVAETGGHDCGCRWGRAGDPIIVSPYDYYGLSKVLAEREVVESGLKHWVVLRQSGILYSGLLMKGMDPITFHVPLNGAMEWTTLEDSGRLMANLCEEALSTDSCTASRPADWGHPVLPGFWRNFYYIGSGREFRMTNYEFEQKILKALGCPPPEKIFEPSWFATRNFHGHYFEDSDRLQEIIPFRENITADEYFTRMSSTLPFYFKFARIVPARLMKMVMKRIAMTPQSDMEIRARFKNQEEKERIGGWNSYKKEDTLDNPNHLSHGYDESKPDAELDIKDMRDAATFHGGRCISTEMQQGDLDTELEWECAFGHRFSATPRLILKGGHWCEHCLPAPWRYDEEAHLNPFLAQVWHVGHDPEEDNIYDLDAKITKP